MDSSVISQTIKEHGRLLGLIDKLVDAIKRLPNDVQWGSSSWLQDLEVLEFVRIQTLSLENAKETAVRGYYRDTYHLLRMVFESYFVLRLISTCDKYPLRVKVTRAKKDRSIEEATKRIIGQLQRKFGNRLIKTYAEDKNILVAILRGIPVVDESGKETGVTVPFFYSAWTHFSATEYHSRRESLQDRLPTLRFLPASGGECRRKYNVSSERITAQYISISSPLIRFWKTSA